MLMQPTARETDPLQRGGGGIGGVGGGMGDGEMGVLRGDDKVGKGTGRRGRGGVGLGKPRIQSLLNSGVI